MSGRRQSRQVDRNELQHGLLVLGSQLSWLPTNRESGFHALQHERLPAVPRSSLHAHLPRLPICVQHADGHSRRTCSRPVPNRPRGCDHLRALGPRCGTFEGSGSGAGCAARGEEEWHRLPCCEMLTSAGVDGCSHFTLSLIPPSADYPSATAGLEALGRQGRSLPLAVVGSGLGGDCVPPGGIGRHAPESHSPDLAPLPLLRQPVCPLFAASCR